MSSDEARAASPLQEIPNDSQTGSSGSVIVVGGSRESANESLQDKFLRFKKERARERALARRVAEKPLAAGSNGDVSTSTRNEEQLRQKFVDACMGYLGVPYSRKSHEPDDPDYDLPLFLDCCGLIRRALLDLQEDFGFTTGKWNQAYQFETLPDEITFEEMKPGDLIFVEGTYYEEGRKPQRHKMVHVEVFIGGETGEATIGSRWAKNNPEEGKVRGVQIHPSYKYVSKKYEIHRFIFKSISTWLHGTCKSTSYPDSATKSLAPLSCGGKSIFEDAESDGDGEQDAAQFVPDAYREAPVFYIGEGNNWKAVAAVLEARGWRRLPFEASFSNRFDLKWVEQRSKHDYKRHLEGQFVNHIPNNDVITCKTKLLDTMHAHERETGQRFAYHPASYTTERASEKLAALAEADANPEAVWALKPSRGNGGKGIELVRGAVALRERIWSPTGLQKTAIAGDGWVVQRYVENPLLVAGRKFDYRAYCLIARTTPHVWFFRPGYCKVALEPYRSDDLENRLAHLTNACVQKSHPDYKELHRGRHIWSEAEVEAELIASGQHKAELGPFWPKIHTEMKKSLAWIYEASRDKLERRQGYFDLLGIDFMLDDDCNLILLELNSNPAMFFDSSPTLEELVPSLLAASIDLVLEAQRPSASPSDPQAPVVSSPTPAAPEPFELLVDEAAGYIWSAP